MAFDLFTAYTWNRLLTVTIPKTVTVQIWQLGLVHKLLVLTVFIYLAISLFRGNAWAYSETPLGSINAFASPAAVPNVGSMEESYSYCNDAAAYSFEYDSYFNYSSPQCISVAINEIVMKRPQLMAVTTLFMELTEVGWPCGESDNDTQVAQCNARNGKVVTEFGTQCICQSKKTYFPVGVDDITLTLTHAWRVEGHTTSPIPEDLSGSSANKECDTSSDCLLDSTVEGSVSGELVPEKVDFESGDSVSMTIKEWLAYANVALDQRNRHFQDKGNVMPEDVDPFFRTTGVNMRIDIYYKNIPNGNKRPKMAGRESNFKRVHATITPEADTSLWAGIGVVTPVYKKYPSGMPGAQSYHKVFRYSQGIVFEFYGHGRIYWFDTQFLVYELIAVSVLLGVAGKITGLIAKYVWFKRKMIRERTMEPFAVGSRLVELALSVTHQAAAFQVLDKNNDGFLDRDDIARSLAMAGADISGADAAAIARLIMARSDNGDDGDQPPKLDFAEFIKHSEGIALQDFEAFKRSVRTLCKGRGYLKAGETTLTQNVINEVLENGKRQSGEVSSHAQSVSSTSGRGQALPELVQSMPQQTQQQTP